MVLTISNMESKPEEDLILDSVCSFYMFPNWDLLRSYEEIKQGGVAMENNQSCRITGINWG